MRRSVVLAFVLGACADPPAARPAANHAPTPIIAPSLQHMAAAAVDSEPAPTFGAPVPLLAAHTTREPVEPAPVESPEPVASRTGNEPTRTLVATSAGAPTNREVVKISAKSERVKIATKPERVKIGSMTGRVKVWSKADHEAVAATSPRVKINAKTDPVKVDAKRGRVKIGSKRDREPISAKPERVKVATQPRDELGTAAPPATPAPSAPATGSATP